MPRVLCPSPSSVARTDPPLCLFDAPECLRDPGSQDHAHHLEQAAQERSIRYPGLWGWLRQWW
ncbi:hypothetical protein [Thermostichus sp. OS-CIW-31]